METRALFWGLESFGVVAFYLIGFAAIGAFIWGVARAVGKYRRGRSSPVPLDLKAGFLRMMLDVASHRTLRRRDRVAGAAHALVFFGFALLFLGTAIITLEYDILHPLWGVTFWKGMFFKVFSLTVDLAGLAVLAGTALLMLRRGTYPPEKLDYRRGYQNEAELRPAARRWQVEDWVFLCAIFFIILSGFVQEGLRHAMESPSWTYWEPVGAFLGKVFAEMDARDLHWIRAFNWWLHGLAALAFIVALPWYKAKHIFAAMGSLAARDPLALRRLPRAEAGAETVGVGKLADFSWKDLLDFDACTKCGRCHEACPARMAGYPLSPRDFILDLRLASDQAQGGALPEKTLIGETIAAETLWSCRTCGACLEICPVGVEHPVKIVKMRRQLVETDRIDPLLKSTLGAIGTSGNSFGEPAKKRANWTRELEFTVKDIRREAADYLWFVGDQASFDPRNQQVSRTVARIFRAAGLDFGLLCESEKTAGNDVRRVGEEGLFEALAEHNLAEMQKAKTFRRIVTTDPHTFNTLVNEYPEFGATAPVAHYTEVLCDLLESGALTVKKPLNLKVTFHDPCHLGRLNKRYDAPRRVLERIGCTLIEMPRNRDNSFCCGAGGGRIWIPESPGTQKPSELRIREAATLGVFDVFVTCCPKDLTMFEDARKTAGFEKDFVVADIAELVAQAIELDAIALADLPNLTEKLTAAIAERVASAVAERLEASLARLPTLATAPPVPAPAVALSAPAAASPLPVTAWAAQPLAPAKLDYSAPAKEGLRLLVPVKQIGKLGDEFSFTADGRGIPSEDFEYLLNEWDDTALEQALQIVEALGAGEVVVVTVGAEDAEATLRKALAKGAHRGVRVWAEGLADADPLAVARLLAGVALAEQPDLILAGAQSGDQANAATGTALAQLLNLPHAVLAVGTDWQGAGVIGVTRELEGGLLHRVELETPALVTLQTGANTPRYATMRMIKLAKEKPVAVVAVAGEEAAFRAASIRRLYVPEAARAAMLEGGADEVAAKVMALIREKMGETA
ncbi:MAG: 4Fe-4S dicluster domain-containing protein [Zoogloeaceae bacterium]|jgi:Fe-S oxidoreductase/electron transfer flavoprotein alpha/beta subunit/nitrate reductase gamma subunit|nr:4Fe-4S dicluster domain-containing protein [Zoogloeaceae bacterium]